MNDAAGIVTYESDQPADDKDHRDEIKQVSHCYEILIYKAKLRLPFLLAFTQYAKKITGFRP